MSLSLFPPNPAYGNGIYRRVVRLRRLNDHAVVGAMDDDYHAMWCRLDHDGSVVTRIDGGFSRAPTTMCAGATVPLAECIGMPIDSDQATLFADGRQRRNCTHLFDLATLLFAQIRRPADTRTYGVAVHDERDGRIVATVDRDGAPVHRWTIVAGHIVAPPPLAGSPLAGGFSRQVRDRLNGDALEGALVLHRGWFVSQARTVLADPSKAYPLIARTENLGVCHAYSSPQIDIGRSIPGNQRDFTDGLIPAPLPPKALA